MLTKLRLNERNQKRSKKNMPGDRIRQIEQEQGQKHTKKITKKNGGTEIGTKI